MFADRFQAERFEEKTESHVRRGTRAGHGRIDEGMVFAIDPRDLSHGLRNVRVLLAFAVLLVQDRANGQHQPPRVQPDRRAHGLGRVQFHHTGPEFPRRVLPETVVAARRARGQRQQRGRSGKPNVGRPERDHAGKYLITCRVVIGPIRSEERKRRNITRFNF